MKEERAQKGIRQLQQLARQALAEATPLQSDQRAQTRYIEEDTAEILVVKQLSADSVQKMTTITCLSGEVVQIPWQKHRLNRQQWFTLSRMLMQQMVPCRLSLLPHQPAIAKCRQLGLQHVLDLGHAQLQDTVPFSIAIAKPDGVLRGFEAQLSDQHHYIYQSDTGLQIHKIEG